MYVLGQNSILHRAKGTLQCLKTSQERCKNIDAGNTELTTGLKNQSPPPVK
jgi:hypothetical protein